MFRRLMVSSAARKRVSWFIAAVLILPFILFFHASGRSSVRGPGGIAGIIFGKRIPWETFEEEREWVRRQVRAQVGEELPEELLGAILTQSAWDRLMILEEGRRRHLRVEDRELATFIQQMDVFQENGRFSRARYHQILLASRTSPGAFEARIRTDLLINKVVDSIKASASVTDEEVRAAYRQTHESLQGSMILLEPSSFTTATAAGLAEADLRASYDQHPEQVQIPAQLVIEYVGHSREELAAGVQPSEAEMDAFYQDHQDEFANPDGSLRPLAEVRALLRQRVADETARQQLTAFGLDLRDDLDARRSFDEIAHSRALPMRSAGPLSADNPAGADGVDPAILQAIGGLPEGQLSDLIETERGVYLARITQRIPPRIPPFAAVRGQVKDRLVHRLARGAAWRAADTLHSHLQARGAAGIRFEEAVLLEGVTLAHPSPFTRTGPIEPVGLVAALNDTAFATPLGRLTDVIETPAGFVIFRPEARIPADESHFAAEQATLRQALLSKRQSHVVEEWLTALRAGAKLQNFAEFPPRPPAPGPPSVRGGRQNGGPGGV